jgi:hypothetical protein
MEREAREGCPSLFSYFSARSSRRRLVNGSAFSARPRHRSACSFKSEVSILAPNATHKKSFWHNRCGISSATRTGEWGSSAGRPDTHATSANRTERGEVSGSGVRSHLTNLRVADAVATCAARSPGKATAPSFCPIVDQFNVTTRRRFEDKVAIAPRPGMTTCYAAAGAGRSSLVWNFLWHHTTSQQCAIFCLPTLRTVFGIRHMASP